MPPTLEDWIELISIFYSIGVASSRDMEVGQETKRGRKRDSYLNSV